MDGTTLFESRHFTLHSVAEGVFAAIAADGGAAISNSGLIDLGEPSVVFDTFLTPQAALDLRHMAEGLLGRTPHLVVNSHYHNDHIWGNQVFAPDALIVSSARTRELIATAGLEELRWYSANSAQRLESLQIQLQDMENEQQRKQLVMWIGYYAGLVEALPQLSVCLPSVTFGSQLTIHGSKRAAQLITFDGAHTGSDTILYLPQDGIVFASDLLFVGCHPYLADGDPLKLLKTLKELSQLDAICFVPGHGPIGTGEDLKLLIEYIEYCLATAQLLVSEGAVSEDRIAELKVADQYTSWQLSQFFQANIRFLCQCLSPANELDQR